MKKIIYVSILLIGFIFSLDFIYSVLPESKASLLFAFLLVPFVSFFVSRLILVEKFITKRSSLFSLFAATLVFIFVGLKINFTIPDSLPPMGGGIADNLLRASLGKIEGEVKKTSYTLNQNKNNPSLVSKGIQGVGGALDLSGISIQMPKQYRVARIIGHFLYLTLFFNILFYVIQNFNKQFALSIKRQSLKNFFIKYIFLILFCSIFLVYIFLNTKMVYFWDYNNYWMRSMTMMDQFSLTNFVAFTKNIISSIFGKEYNELPTIPIVFWGKFFGLSRISYVFSLLFLFFAPSLCILAYREDFKSFIKKSIPFLLLMPFFITNIFDGFVVTGGYIFAGLFLQIYFKVKDKPQFLDSVVLAFLLLMTSIFIRWYLFWAVGIIMAMLCDAIIDVKRERSLLESRLIFISQFAIVNFLALTLFLGPLFSRILGANYGDIYSDMNLGLNYFEKILLVIQNIGIIPFLIIIGLLFSNLKSSKSIFISISWIIPTLIISKIQFLGLHHIVGLVALPLYYQFITSSNEKLLNNKIVYALILLIGFINTYTHLSFSGAPLADSLSKLSLFTSIRKAPIYRNDIDELLSLNQVIDQEATKGKRTYVLASSLNFNDEILGWLEVSMGLTQRPISRPQIMRVHHIDKRDKIPTQLLEADLIVVPDKIQIHYPPSSQDVIVRPWILLKKQTYFSKNYKIRSRVFNLDIGKVYIYEKVKDFTSDDIQKFIKEFDDLI